MTIYLPKVIRIFLFVLKEMLGHPSQEVWELHLKDA
jgi:hypothetical protein